MENNKKRVGEPVQSLDDISVDAVAGGANIKKLICCTCGREVEISGLMGQYYNANICPYCRGKLKSW